MKSDTITALATPPGQGGIAIIRISGSKAYEIAGDLYVNKRKEKVRDFKDRYFNYGYILDTDGSIIDEVFTVFMKGPRTYTAEDVVEIHCHGGMVPVRKITEIIIAFGARLAEPGEFTKRAFLRGRIDLSQAEAVMDLISARTEEAAKSSLNQMQGSLTSKIGSLRQELLTLLAHIEVTVDYPEEDIEDVFIEEIKTTLNNAREEANKLLESADQGRLIREGIKTVIIGRPNVGKSSLLNALLKDNRAIVTDVPGTTRDVIEEQINIRGVLVNIIDTAGIRETLDLVEKIGVERSREMIVGADLILLILDASDQLSEDDKRIIEWLGDRRVLVLLNKTDRPLDIDEGQVRRLTPAETIKTSMVDGTGLEEIEDYIYNMVHSGKLTPADQVLITNTRHKEALLRAGRYLKEALGALEASIPLDMVTIDIREVLDALGKITGESLTEGLIDTIFADFCLGK
ncbi:MAG TPA: tRNA uridine-5-carboxymethylaminomethyl(34) synthesis GTPase MnmE [Bacillota bacterium]|nr:tRNA uridine-5-carboxymethylaminomethyl(34) synthesis GTPase MnmE [Bacillota bacterium]